MALPPEDEFLDRRELCTNSHCGWLSCFLPGTSNLQMYTCGAMTAFMSLWMMSCGNKGHTYNFDANE